MRVQVTIISRRRCNRENRVRNSCTSREHNGSLKISQRAYRSVIIIVIGITIPLSALSSNLGCDFRRDMWRVVLISKSEVLGKFAISVFTFTIVNALFMRSPFKYVTITIYDQCILSCSYEGFGFLHKYLNQEYLSFFLF